MRMPMFALAAFAGLLMPALAQTHILTIDEQTQSIPSAPQESEATPAPAPATPPELGSKPDNIAPSEPPASAQPQSREAQAPPSPPPPRFSFKRADSGFLRLDSQTGQVAYCSGRGVGWACHAVPEDRAALEQEIARLQDQVARLKEEIAALRDPPPPALSPEPPRPPADLVPPPAEKGNELIIKLPTQEDIDRASAAVQSAWRRLVDMLVQFKNDMLPKG